MFETFKRVFNDDVKSLFINQRVLLSSYLILIFWMSKESMPSYAFLQTHNT